MLLEKRSNPELNPKTSIYDNLEKYYDLKVVALYENKEYSKEKEKEKEKAYSNKRFFTFKGKKYIGEIRNGILYFTDLYIGNLGIKSLKELPWSNQTHAVSNNFDCSSNLLEDLEGGPIYAEMYICSFNELKSLKGAPDKVESFNCSSNKDLTTLRYSPKIVEEFICSGCSIESLQYISDNINYLNYSFNKLKNLKYSPKLVKALDCSNNPLKSLKGAPEECFSFICVDCGLTSLKGAPKKIIELDISNNDIRSLKELEECKIIWCHGNENLKLDFKPKKLESIEGVSIKRKSDFLVKNQLEE